MPTSETDKHFLDIFAAGAPQRAEPQLDWRGELPPPPAPVPQPAPRAPLAPPFEADSPLAPENCAPSPLLARAAELMRRPDAATPFAVGLLSGAGGGKTSALRGLEAMLRQTGATVVSLRAAELAGDPDMAIAAALYRGLAQGHAAFAEEAVQSGAHRGADAGALARLTQDRLDAVRRKLVNERLVLTETQGRLAAVADVQLYETPGSRVDAYSRRLRARFEPRLRRFGFTGDAIANFKDLARDVSETGAFPKRVLHGLRALYAYRGQTRLFVYAALAYALGRCADWLYANNAGLLSSLDSTSFGAQIAAFARAHVDWLPTLSTLLGWGALALVALNVWRAFSFMQPLIQAAGLLDEDVAAKRHEIEQVLAHQARNVEAAGAEVAALGARAAEIDRRAAAAGAARHPPPFVEDDADGQKRAFARGFLESLAELVAARAEGAPRKILVTVDGFEAVAEPARLFARVHEALARPGLLSAFALDPAFVSGAELARRVQLPLRLDVEAGGLPLAPLDAPLSDAEAKILDLCALLAGSAPRLKKRFRNFYRFLHPAPEAAQGSRAALALLLAAEQGAGPDVSHALAEALHGAGPAFAPKGPPALLALIGELAALDGAIDVATARKAASLARAVTAG